MYLNGTPLKNKYVEITAMDAYDARDIMISWFGTKWAFQYKEDDWEGVMKEFPEYELLEQIDKRNENEVLGVNIL